MCPRVVPRVCVHWPRHCVRFTESCCWRRFSSAVNLGSVPLGSVQSYHQLLLCVYERNVIVFIKVFCTLCNHTLKKSPWSLKMSVSQGRPEVPYGPWSPEKGADRRGAEAVHRRPGVSRFPLCWSCQARILLLSSLLFSSFLSLVPYSARAEFKKRLCLALFIIVGN